MPKFDRLEFTKQCQGCPATITVSLQDNEEGVRVFRCQHGDNHEAIHDVPASAVFEWTTLDELLANPRAFAAGPHLDALHAYERSS